MTSADLLPATVLKRKAVVYVRQSTQTQVQTSTTVVIERRVSYPSRMNRDGGADGGFGLVGRGAAVV
jgi:hypothetical protein